MYSRIHQWIRPSLVLSICFKIYRPTRLVYFFLCEFGGLYLSSICLFHLGYQTCRHKLVQLLLFSHSVMSNSLRPHGLQQAGLPCPSPSPGVCSNSCPLSQWYHPTISSSVILFSSCTQSFPASRSFPMNQLYASGGQSIRAIASASILPMNIQGLFPLGLTDLISLPLRDSQQSFPTPQFKSINSSALSFLHSPTLTFIHEHWKNHSFD